MGAFREQVALVTGASRGIGRAIARQLAAQGATVVVNFRQDEVAARETVDLIERAGGRAESRCFDIADPEAAASGVQAAAQVAGRLDILVNNAGVTLNALLLRTRVEDWDGIMATNLRGMFNCTRAAAKSMVRARYGRIVNLSSVVGLMGNAGQAAYATAKAGVVGFTKSIARELASRNVTVNAVAPGFIDTEMVARLPEGRRKGYLEAIPAGRLGTVDEVAGAVIFLARRDSAYVTGQVIGVNGGLYM